MFDIKEELKKLPMLPGVYLMKDRDGHVIYVGKAKNLKNRVPSYFRGFDSHTSKTQALVVNIKSFEYIVTSSEVEALIVESDLIKKYQPKYNILLKDSKAYPYIEVTVTDQYPKVLVSRQLKKDNNKYFGPFVDSRAVDEVLDIINDNWKLRSCALQFPRDLNKNRPCLNHHIGKCLAPCNEKISKEEYDKNIEEIMDFLNGNTNIVISKLTTEMLLCSQKLEFEQASVYRDKISAINRLSKKQSITKVNSNNQDIISIAMNKDKALVMIFLIRNGKMLGKEQFLLDYVERSKEEVIESFINQYYTEITFIPKAIVLENMLPNQESILEKLSFLKQSNVSVVIPKKGEKLRLLNLCRQNAEITLLNFGKNLEKEHNRTIGALEEIQFALGLPFLPKRIEAIDISNTSGVLSVGSMVVFENGVPKSSDYRKFKIKTVVGANDVKSIEEVVTRRFKRYLDEKQNGNETKFSTLPDLLLIDGGRNQVNAAIKALQDLNITVTVAGMVKDDKHRTRGLYFNDKEVIMKMSSEGFKLLTRIQDEVHRFAINYHKALRTKNQVKTVLEDIEGLGKKRIQDLLRHFGSIENIKKASLDELVNVSSINTKTAENIIRYFNIREE